MMQARRFLAGLALVVLALAVVTNAAVDHWTPRNPARAQGWWPGHPRAELALAQIEIARAAAAGRAPQPATFTRLDRVASRMPLAVEPLLARGVAAQQVGQVQRSRRLFELAEQRRPRELAPHYFLADADLRAGNVEGGMRQLVRLARLSPSGIGSVAPHLAAFARNPDNWPQISATFAREPALASAVLGTLAADPANVAALLALAKGTQRRLGASWIPVAIAAQVKARRYPQARQLWAQLSGVADRGDWLVYDPDFRDGVAPPPFNWELAQSAVGSAERRPGQGLHVLVYGSQSGSLARQLLVLRPGRYRLITTSQGKIADPQALSWTLSCDSPANVLADVAVKAGTRIDQTFAVPANCPAQYLSLDARAQDIRGDSEIRVPYVRIERLGA